MNIIWRDQLHKPWPKIKERHYSLYILLSLIVIACALLFYRALPMAGAY